MNLLQNTRKDRILFYAGRGAGFQIGVEEKLRKLRTMRTHDGNGLKAKIERQCKNCGMKVRQHVSFSEDNEKIVIKVWRYKCPFCDTFLKKPTAEEIKKVKTMDNV